MTFDLSAFSSYTHVLGQTVQMGTKATAHVAGKGDVVINIMTNGSPSTLKLTNILHVPSFKFQLLSVSQMYSRGIIVEVKDGQCKIKSDNIIIASGSSRGSLYVLDTPKT